MVRTISFSLVFAAVGVACGGTPYTNFTSSSTAGGGGGSSSASGGGTGAGGAGGEMASSSSTGVTASSSSSGAVCPAAACTQDSDCGPALPCASRACATGCCTTTPAPTTAPCDDGDPCTSEDHCDGAGACAAGEPVPVVYTYGGSLPNGSFPAGTPGGFCLYGATYCSSSGPQNVAPPPGYTTGTSAPADACDANSETAPHTWVQAFCKACKGNCETACP